MDAHTPEKLVIVRWGSSKGSKKNLLMTSKTSIGAVEL
jgi:hypothetical protein